MLGQQHGYSKTLPRFDGQDEMETDFEIASLVNSCPDLSVLVCPGPGEGYCSQDAPRYFGEDTIDGLFKGYHKKIAGNFPRSFSLINLMGIDEVGENKTMGKDNGSPMRISTNKCFKEPLINNNNNNNNKGCKKASTTTVLVRSPLRNSHNGAASIQKSISSPIFFKGISSNDATEYRLKNLQDQRPGESSNSKESKRSFFRRKNKSKPSSHNSNVPVVPHNNTNNYKSNNQRMEQNEYNIDENFTGTLGNVHYGWYALYDPTLALQEVDAECWAFSMNEDVVSNLDEKEVKRQEHMYEFILTEKHHCLTLALMHHLFLGGMKKAGFSHLSRQFFPGLVELLHVHFNFLRKMREVQIKFRDQNKPLESLTSILHEQFTGDQWQLLIRLYGRLCSTHAKSLEMFKNEMKNPKFANLVSTWGKEPLLARKNVPECLLLVAQRITKYPLLIEPLKKTTMSIEEKELISNVLNSSKELIFKVNERVAERQNFTELCQKFDKNSNVLLGKRRIGREEILTLTSRRLLFSGQANVISNRVVESGNSGAGPTKIDSCNIFILTDCILFMQEFSGRYHFVYPPGMVMLKQLIVREKERHSSFYLVLANDTTKPDLIELNVINPPFRDIWLEKMRHAILNCEEEIETGTEGEEESSDTGDFADVKLTKALDELYETDSQILSLLRSRTRLIENLRSEKPHHWNSNNFDGRDDVLNSISVASNEVQRVVTLIDNNSNVNRSASCVAQHVSAGALLLPKRADTFGGFDSQQRSTLDFYQNLSNNKVLYQMVIQLSDVCGMLFQQMLPHVTLQAHQNSHQLQRRLEELREAQRKLETEKAQWSQELAFEKEKMEKVRSDLGAQKEALHQQEADVIEQREKLYRKLEALQRQGIRPSLDSKSPAAALNAVEKNSSVVPARRPIPPIPLNQPSIPTQNLATASGVKQKLPLHLAAFSSSKLPPGSSSVSPNNNMQSQQNSSTTISSGPPRAASRNSFISSKNNSPQQQQQQQQMIPTQLERNGGGSDLGLLKQQQSSQQPSARMRQMLPLQLSESNLKLASLSRGVGSSRSVSNITSGAEMNQHHPMSIQQLRSSVSASQVIPHNNNFGHLGGVNINNSDASHLSSDNNKSNTAQFFQGISNQDRMNNYYNDSRFSNIPNNNGFYTKTASGEKRETPIHRRSGSSPVPISNSASSSQDYLDDEKILFI